MGGGGGYEDKKERKEGGSTFGQKAVAGVAADKYSLGSVVGSKWDAPLPSAKDAAPGLGGNFPSVASGRASFIRNARYAPGVNPSSRGAAVGIGGFRSQRRALVELFD